MFHLFVAAECLFCRVMREKNCFFLYLKYILRLQEQQRPTSKASTAQTRVSITLEEGQLVIPTSPTTAHPVIQF
jgi:hypothetical protein